MNIVIGSARIDENGKAVGGKAGDQTGREVCTEKYYMSGKGWYVFRPKNVTVANAIADAMICACQNDNIGYDQGERLGVIAMLKKYGRMSKIAEKTEADCSSLVRGCCIEAGFDPGNFNTSSEPGCLEKSGKFEQKFSAENGTVLYNGDILVTKTKGHTVVVVSGNPRKAAGSSGAGTASGDATYYPKYTGASVSITTALSAVGEKDTSKGHRAKIAAANGIKNYAYTAAQNTQMVKLLKAGTLKRA